MHLVSTLRTLARGGRAILTTIHQPSSRLYQQLDRLMLLSQGHMLYYGDANAVADWFGQLGCVLARTELLWPLTGSALLVLHARLHRGCSGARPPANTAPAFHLFK